MMDLTVGRCCSVTSKLQALDPRTRLFLTFVYAATVFIAGNPAGVMLTSAALVILVVLSAVPLRIILKALLPLAFFIVATAAITAVAGSGVMAAAVTVWKIVCLVTAFNILSFTTKPRDIAAGIEAGPGRIFPLHNMATMLAIAMHFIPILLEEASRIADAQRSRGADFSGNIFKRARAAMPLLVPLFVSSFSKADNLAAAMDARLYGTGTATRLHPLKFKLCDIFALIVILLYLAAVILMRTCL